MTRPVLRGLGASVAIAAGYVPVAFAFGLTTVQLGLGVEWAVAISAIVYAGASQFVLVSLVAAGGGPLAVVATVWLLNARHLLYGGVVAGQLAQATRPRAPAALAFGLTDEVFACAAARLPTLAPEQRAGWLAGVQAGAYVSWVAGTWLGAQTGVALVERTPLLREALQFVLPALFLTLLLQLGVRGRAGALWGGGGVTLLGLALLPVHLAIPLGMLAGAAIQWWLAKDDDD
jgi:4-azaleucine resistance transporter AzlC